MTRGLPHLCPVPTQSLTPGSPLPLMCGTFVCDSSTLALTFLG